ncbi:MAG TPA: DUF3857 domain-containing protein, partial [Polyangiales bacterium]|nr:DUF3857 domain-containing protein [Polyangiales bacterium]
MRNFTLATLCVACALLARDVRADAPINPVDAENAKLVAKAADLGRKPEGVLPLLELWDHWDDSTPSNLRALLDKLATDKRLSPPRRVMVQALAAEARARLGEPEALGQAFSDLGYVTRFRVIGPFDNEGKAGFDTETPPEQKRMEAPDPLAHYPGRERPVAWRELPDIARSGFVPFGAVLRPYESVCALAETFVKSDKARPLSLWAGAGGAIKVYWNGEVALRDAAYRHPSPDRSVAMVGAHAGWNRLLVKVCTTNTAWGFQLRIGDEHGGVAQGLTIATNTTAALDIAAGNDKKVKLPKAPVSTLTWFEDAAKVEKPKADVLADFARYLDLSGSDDPAERRAKQLAERAVDLDPSADNLELAAQLAEERAEVLRFTDRASALHPDDPVVRMLVASSLASGPSPESALPVLAKIDPASEQGTAAVLMRVGILRDLELSQAALALLQEQHARIGDTPEILHALADAESDAAHPDRALAVREHLLTLRYDDAETRHALIDDALARSETKRVLDHIDALRATTPGSARTLLYIAGLYDALGRDDMVLAAYREALEIVPEAETVMVAYARALMRTPDHEAAADQLRKALAIKPQDAEARDLLESLKPEPRNDEGYALSTEQLLARRTAGKGYPYTVLQDLDVRTVFDNGLGSSFRQVAVQVNDSEGARRFRTHSFTYDPDSQHVDLRLSRVYRKDGRVLESVRTYEEQLGEPWYRVYYDTRAVVVVFPDLEPGDVVEVRYRIDDVAHRNLYADYFGDVHMFQDFVPVQTSDYVLITPMSRTIYSNAPKFAGLTHSQQIDTKNKRRIDRYTAQNVAPIVQEDSMPGMTESSPFLHVSTYKSWEDVGRWYWGLIKDQLYADASLKRVVADLVKDATTTREKVERIH